MSHLQVHEASPEMQKFFGKLLDLKFKVQERVHGSDTTTEQERFQEIYNMLDEVIKEKTND